MLKLLIVDDEPIIRSGIRTIIEWEKYGFEICGEAEDGPSAVEAISELRPDLVLLDLHLPGFSGLEVIRKTRGKGRGAHFLILSGYAEFEYAQEAFNLEADGYMVKPIDEDVLVERIVFIARKIKESDEQRQIQFLEIMEGANKNFSDGYVQAVFVSVENLLSEERIRRLQTLKGFFQEDICHVFQYREFIVFLFENTPEAVIKHLLENLYDSLLKSQEQSDVTLGSRCREESSSPGLGIRKTCQEAELLMENIFFYRGKKYLSLEDVQAKKDAGPDWDAEEEAKKLCSYIQVVDNQKIRSFFRDMEDKFSHLGKSPQEVRQECMALMI